MSAQGQVVGIAQAEVGYLEKSLRAWDLYGINCLYDKTKYAGADNITKYAYETGHAQNQPWCMTFVVWVFMAAFGKDKANKLLCGKFKSASTMDTKDAMVKAGRQVPLEQARGGDIVFRSRSGGGHVGIVKGVQNGKIVTIEGNTSVNDPTAWNGGCVGEHVGGSWKWCCRPDYSIVVQEDVWKWVQVDGIWYYQNQDGVNKHDWEKIKETDGTEVHWYFFDNEGRMQTGAQKIGGNWCFFMPEGSLQGALCITDNLGYQHVWDI